MRKKCYKRSSLFGISHLQDLTIYAEAEIVIILLFF